MRPLALDHVALWTDERQALTRLLVQGCGMHVIDETAAFTLVGGDARAGKLTLFTADGPRQRGMLERVELRVPELARRLQPLADAVVWEDGAVVVDAPGDLTLALRPGGPLPDLDRVVLRVPEPERSAAELGAYGLPAEGTTVAVDGRRLELVPGPQRDPERPLLNHIALLVDSAAAAEEHAREAGLPVDRVVDAPNTRAVFVRGPDGLSLEYVEHKASFALA